MPLSTTTCRELIDALDEYGVGELSPERRRSFDTHLAGCAQCTAYLESYRATMGIAKHALSDRPENDSPIPDELAASILRQRKRNR
jgi:anti-sigma factor RsiW